jgi:hypothetical protein
VKIIGLITLAAVLHATAFAQKPADPESRNKRAVSVAPTRPANSVRTQQSHYDATSVPKTGSSSARDLAKIEQSSVHQIKTSPKKNASLKPGPVPAKQAQTKRKPIKFSYQPPKTAAKTSAKNSSPPVARSRPVR